ncbi:MAG: hypothetical protein WKF88_09340 [Ferruginibacter sp.]
MGKASKFKKLRKLAASLPEVNTKRVIGCEVTGNEVIAQGVDEVNGVEVDENAKYHQRKTIATPMNHNRNLKRNFYRNGMDACAKYATAVVNFAEQNSKPEPLSEKP